MSLDTKSAVANAIYSSQEMSKSATTTQINRYKGVKSNSFASEMAASSENAEAKEQKLTSGKEVEKKDKTEETAKDENVKRSDTKKSGKVSKEQNQDTQTLKGEVSSDNQAQNSPQNNSNQDSNNQQNPYNMLSEQIQACINANRLDINNFVSFNPMAATNQSQLSNLPPVVNYTNIQMSETDAKFFADLVTNTDMSAASVAAQFEKNMQHGNIKMVQSTAKASFALIEALKESSKNHQAFRIDFDKDISVIMQVDKGGKINANFIPGDAAVQNYLKNNIESLRQRFDEENIAYGDLTYSQSRRQKQEQEKRNNNKESRS